MAKQNNLTYAYYAFIKRFLINHKINERIFFQSVCHKWGIQKYHSAEQIHKTLLLLYEYLDREPERFIDYAITWMSTPLQGDKEWWMHNNNFQKEYTQWKSIQT